MSNPPIHTESAFESAIVAHLCNSGWQQGRAADFSTELALDKATVLAFVQATQPREWQRLQVFYKEETANKFLQRLFKELELRGMIDVVRHGITDSGVKFKLAYFQPDSERNPDTVALYTQNILSVTRQLQFSAKNSKSIDLLLSLNGLPLATMELKNHFTGQRVREAMEQYRTSRDPKELLFQFKKRALVHFTVDPDEVYFTTKLEGAETRFFPFNKGNNNGAGNPPVAEYNNYRSAYFWEEILQPASWLEIIARFLHLHKEEYVFEGVRYSKESLLFPRYHQLDAVRKLSAHAKQHGKGHRYLIQHSAGSGKSNSIAWLAHRLSTLFDSNSNKIFDSVVVVTDRSVLDQQLQSTIYQFEHRQGVVQRIDTDSEQLAKAIQAGVNIIITTLQKFPYALRHLSNVPDRNYAVIIDEAHSSQGGDASRNMTAALAQKNIPLEEAARMEADAESAETDDEDFIHNTISENIRLRGPQPNISIFAFTATPKAKTLEVFGTHDAEGKPKPFHLYSMRQAIEEGFILDVLKNYTTYTQYYRFSKAIEDDPELNKKKALQAIGRFASLHPTSIAQKTEVMIEHFRQVTMKKIGGRAKAMVVTSSRKHALRYYLGFKEYIQEKGYTDIKPLVAFSGAVFDDLYPEGISEAQLNGFGEKELPEKFSTPEYQILLVADKYQTGFDQPLLHTMYIDKKLSGVKAVQTLSRLNRTYPGKEDTFVLDFANERETIIESFQPYYELTTLTNTTEHNHLYDLKGSTDRANVYYHNEVDAFARVFYAPGNNLSYKEQGKLYGMLSAAVERYKALHEEAQEEFKNALTAYVHLYSFLSQILPFRDVELEKLYSFGRFLLSQLPKGDYTERLRLNNEVALAYYRLQKVAEGDLVLQIQGEHGLDPTTEAGIRRAKDEKEKLSNIIHLLNSKYGTDFTDADKIFFEQIEQSLYENEELQLRALSNPLENFRYAFEEVFIQALIERLKDNEEIVDKIMAGGDFGQEVKNWLTRKIYQRFNTHEGQGQL